MKNASIRILFFDIGGVLLSDGWGHAARQEAAKHFGLDYAEMEISHGFIFNIYEIGSIVLDDYLDTVIFNQPRDFTREKFKAYMYSQSMELPNMLQWLKEWKPHSGFRIISINNEGRELNEYRIKKFKLNECFDAFISSCEVSMRKPDPRIYKLAMGVAQASPEECIYIDDRLVLVQAAQKHGIQSFHHQDFLSTKKILEDLKNNNNRK